MRGIYLRLRSEPIAYWKFRAGSWELGVSCAVGVYIQLHSGSWELGVFWLVAVHLQLRSVMGVDAHIIRRTHHPGTNTPTTPSA